MSETGICHRVESWADATDKNNDLHTHLICVRSKISMISFECCLSTFQRKMQIQKSHSYKRRRGTVDET